MTDYFMNKNTSLPTLPNTLFYLMSWQAFPPELGTLPNTLSICSCFQAKIDL